MLPFVAWFTAVIGWVVLTLEAVAACPVWLVGHCMPEGDGFAGASARSGYALMLSVLLRPMLLVLAFFLCMIILSVSGYLVSSLLMPFFDAQDEAFRDNAFGLSGWGVTAAVSTLVLLGSVVGIGTWKLFTLVTVMPDRIIRWAGESDDCLQELLSIRETRTTVESFERLVGRSGLTIADRSLFFINPHYKVKFKLPPCRLPRWASALPYLRNFLCSSCWYLLQRHASATS